MRKLLSALLVLALALGMTSGIATAEEDPYAEHYTITWTTYLNAPITEDAVLIKAVEEKFNVDIDMLNIEDNDFLEVLNTRIAGGDIPDVIRLKDPSQLITYIDQGVVGAINMDIVREHLPYVCEMLDNFQDGAYWTMGMYEGQQYGIPAIAAGNVFHLPIVYNKTWMDAVGVEETPTTLAELEDLMYKFAKDDPDGDGVDDTYGLSSDGMRLVFGAYGINPGACDGRNDHSYFQLIDGQVQWAAATEQYREALTLLAKWYADGVIDPEFITGENTGGYWAISHSFVNGRIGMTVRGNYYHWVMPGMYQDYDADGNLTDVVAGAVANEFITANPDSELVYGSTVEGPYGQGVKSWNLLAQFYVFSPSATADEGKFTRIMDIMNYMELQYKTEGTEDKQEVLEFMYGEEGTYWFWKDKEVGEYGLTELYYDTYPEFAAVDEYGPTQWGPSLATKQTSKAAQFAYSLGYDENGIANLIQFSLPAMAEYQSNLTSLKDSWMINFITGKASTETDWDAYLAEMNAAGLDEMLAEVQEWYGANQ
ncbi:MAG TPA: extracellular solute-binding protein [Candidatus Limiplasma sp.]|nr:extracellular solute-binding protein [Candidatus Limiplasma sp.]